MTAVGMAASTVTTASVANAARPRPVPGPEAARDRLGGEVTMEGEQVEEGLPHRGHPGAGEVADAAHLEAPTRQRAAGPRAALA